MMTEYYLNEEARRAKKILKARGVNLSHIVQNALIKEAGLKESVNPYKEQMKAIKQKSLFWERENKQSSADEDLKRRRSLAVEFRRLCNEHNYEELKPLLKMINKRLTRSFKVLVEVDKFNGQDPFKWWIEQYDKIH